MKRLFFFLFACILFLTGAFAALFVELDTVSADLARSDSYNYWFLLHRKSNIEFLYQGVSGDIRNSVPVRVFSVKTGRPGERPTPLPQLLGKEYWVITAKQATDNPETAPYFITLDIPISDQSPYGPVPYLECAGQCDWVLPGAFGLHGVNGDESRLSSANRGSSGCIRHKDEDITYLYNLLNPEREIRYFIHNN